MKRENLLISGNIKVPTSVSLSEIRPEGGGNKVPSNYSMILVHDSAQRGWSCDERAFRFLVTPSHRNQGRHRGLCGKQ